MEPQNINTKISNINIKPKNVNTKIPNINNTEDWHEGFM